MLLSRRYSRRPIADVHCLIYTVLFVCSDTAFVPLRMVCSRHAARVIRLHQSVPNTPSSSDQEFQLMRCHVHADPSYLYSFPSYVSSYHRRSYPRLVAFEVDFPGKPIRGHLCCRCRRLDIEKRRYNSRAVPATEHDAPEDRLCFYIPGIGPTCVRDVERWATVLPSRREDAEGVSLGGSRGGRKRK